MKFYITVFEVMFLIFCFGVIMSLIHDKVCKRDDTWKDHAEFGLAWAVLVNLTIVFVTIVHVVGVWIFTPLR
jgi:hypothetical protein